MACGLGINPFRRKELGMATMTSPALYIHDGGQIACPAHFGAYAAAELKRHPAPASSRRRWAPGRGWARTTSRIWRRWASWPPARPARPAPTAPGGRTR